MNKTISFLQKKLKKSSISLRHNLKGKKCFYKRKDGTVISLDSSWEVKYAEFLDMSNIKWKRNTMKFPYYYKGKKYNYIPDFFLSETSTYVEIKGLKTDRDDAKWEYFRRTNKLVVLFKEDLKKMNILK